ncbi:MAG TPA: 50S ribosomal protein L18 [Saprospiraceae bacterium]|nr:50S ribosomal protein L18 [Saprospiraceae bacterium]
MSFDKIEKRQRIRYRIRHKIRGSANKPRLSVFRSNKEIYCQLIDDLNGKTLAAASSSDESLQAGGNKTERAKTVGQLIGQRALDLNIDSVVFDRGGYIYHGRVKALAEGAREKGLKF